MSKYFAESELIINGDEAASTFIYARNKWLIK